MAGSHFKADLSFIRGKYEKNAYCRPCAQKKRKEKFASKSEKTWDRETPLTIFDTDIYFWRESDLEDYCQDNDVLPKDLELVICEPERAKHIDYDDFYCDELPQDTYLSDVDSELAALFDKVNEYISKKQPILSWWEGKYKAVIKE